jgi:hypothetical protein
MAGLIGKVGFVYSGGHSKPRVVGTAAVYRLSHVVPLANFPFIVARLGLARDHPFTEYGPFQLG